jgi:hypothetical protein
MFSNKTRNTRARETTLRQPCTPRHASPAVLPLFLALLILVAGCGDAPGTTNVSPSIDAGDAAPQGGNSDQAARCAEQCSAGSACPSYPWSSQAECRRACEQFLEPGLPVACASLMQSVAACETSNFGACQFDQYPCPDGDCIAVCSTERGALADCMRGAVACEGDFWGLWYTGGMYTSQPATGSLGIVHQWGCRCAGPRSGAPAGGACAGDEDCVSVCCSCPSSQLAFGLQHCGADGRCAGTEACAAELQYNGLLLCP